MTENVRKISKKYYLRQIVACWLVCWMGLGLPLQVAMAIPPGWGPDPTTEGPLGDGFVHGVGAIEQITDRITGVTVQTQESIIHWNSLDTISGEQLNYGQDGVAGAAVLNRVISGIGTEFYGNLSAETGMKIFVINPAGILFGSGASINVTQLVASSLDIADDDFLNGLPYSFTGGATAGDIVNEGTDTINAEQIALIGKQVINRGSLVADDYVIMVAGETVVLQADPGASDVAVVVSMPEQTPGEYDYVVDQGGENGTGEGSIEANHVILAAGDIWSTAIAGVETLRAEAKGNAVFTGEISAYAENASDAVADVTIITSGDFTVDNQIMAEAEADGGGDNAFATVLIDAGGDLVINDRVKAEADAEDGAGNATATVDLTAGGSVTVNENGEDNMVQADVWITDDSGSGEATLNITALGGNVEIYDSIKSEAETSDESGNATASIDIDAAEKVKIDNAEVTAEATTYTMLEPSPGMLEGPEDTVIDLTVSGRTATATVDIDATNGDVKIEGGEVEAEAKNEVEIEIGDWFELDELTVNLTVQDFTTNAGVTISAGDDVKVEAEWDEAEVGAEAYHEFEVMGGPGVDQSVTLNLTIDDIENNANIDITASGDDVKVFGYSGEAEIEAEAYNKLSDNSDGLDGDVTADNIVNTATVDIAADDVKVIADNWEGSGEASIGAEAYNEGDYLTGEPEPGDVLPENMKNTASVDIIAGGEVQVIAKDGSEAWIGTDASFGTDNTAAIDIVTGGDVLVHGIDSYAGIEAWAAYGVDNVATIDIDAIGGDVKVIDVGGENNVETSKIEAWAEIALNSNTADVQISATATTSEYEEEVEGVTLTYVEVEGGDVKVIAKDGGHAEITAVAKDAEGLEEPDKDEDGLPVDGPSNTANVKIKATGAEGTDFEMVEPAVYEEVPDVGSVLVEPAVFEAVTYTEGGDVKVKALGYGSGPDSEASIKAVTVKGFSNDSDVLICAEDVAVIGGEDDDGDEYGNAEILALAHVGHLNDAYVGINARGILDVLSFDGEASIESMAFKGYSNTAYTLICAEDVWMTAAKEDSESRIRAGAEDGKLNTADVDLIFRDDVVLEAKWKGKVEIEAEAEGGRDENNAHVGIWTDGSIEVIATTGGEAGIAAEAENYGREDGTDNTADVKLVAGGDIRVEGTKGGNAEIEAEAANGDNVNNASVGLWADGDVVVTASKGGDAEIAAEAEGGIDNDAAVAVCAEGDVVVASGFNPDDIDIEEGIPDGSRGTATIKAVAEADEQTEWISVYNEETQQWEEVEVETSADATVKVVSHNGGVAVVDIKGEDGGQTATILADASDAYYNTADVGVSAGGNLLDGILTEDSDFYDDFYDMTGGLGVGVLVAGIGYDSKATILAYAHNGTENTADTVICTPDIVAVIAEDFGRGDGPNPFAQIKSRAGAYFGGDDDAANTATTQVYAGDVFVYVPTTFGGQGIWASAKDASDIADSPNVGTEFLMSEYDGEFGIGMLNWTVDNLSDEIPGDDSATLIIDTYANAVDCPTCDPRPEPPACPTCEEEQDVASAAIPAVPIIQFVLPLIEGCPAEMGATALELGITGETIQVAIADALALNPSIQPCQACATLIDAAAILRDEDGSRMAAMNAVFNELAPAGSPFTPEMSALIVTAFADAAEGSQYASVAEYVDAFVRYVAVLDTDLGSPVGDSLAFVMDKYGTGLTASENSNIAAFVATRLESGATFGD